MSAAFPNDEHMDIVDTLYASDTMTTEEKLAALRQALNTGMVPPRPAAPAPVPLAAHDPGIIDQIYHSDLSPRDKIIAIRRALGEH